jgi:hypothetical protein
MSLDATLDAAPLRDVRIERISEYVRTRGWVAQQGRRQDVALFRKPDTRGGEIAIPLDRSFRDFDERLQDALTIVAAIEATSVADLLKRLFLPDVDLVRWRRDDSAVTAGSLPLDEGIEFYDGARRAFLASAHTAISPALYYSRLGKQDAESYVSECRMGQTEEGSFVATFYCPLRAANDTSATREHFVPTIEPFGRRVTRLMVEQFRRVGDAVRQRDVEVLTKVTTKGVVVSGNFCEAILQMASPTVRELGVSVDWSKSHPTYEREPAPLMADDFALIADFARELKPREQQRSERFLGKIGTLTANPEIEQRFGGDVTLHTVTGDGPVRARIHLEPAEYAEAVRAHEHSLYVEVKGVLARKAGGTRISEPQGFHVLASIV